MSGKIQANIIQFLGFLYLEDIQKHHDRSKERL